MNIILSHPTGNANVRAVANGLLHAGMLFNFQTSIASFQGTTIDKLGRFGPFSEVRRRRFSLLLQPFTNQWPWYEAARILALKMKLKSLTTHETGFLSTDNIFKRFDQRVASTISKAVKRGADGVYAYEDVAFDTFKNAKQFGVKCIYDLPIAYWETGRKLMIEEAARLPQWSVTLGGGIMDSEEKLKRKTKELELADMVMVPGKFVYDSLPNWAQNKKIIISPFGTPKIHASLFKSDSVQKKQEKRKLRVLFVGSMGQRKGLGDLFEAIKLMDRADIELVVMGSLLAPLEFYRQFYPDFIYEAGRPHEQVLELMRTCDVFCLPSIVEGRALVMQEAMSQGLPIIITPNTGGADLVIEGETGFLVPIRSPKAIADRLVWFLENRSSVREMGRLAQEHALTYTWEAYGLHIAQSIDGYFKNC